jgi:hypothetical protein
LTLNNRGIISAKKQNLEALFSSLQNAVPIHVSENIIDILNGDVEALNSLLYKRSKIMGQGLFDNYNWKNINKKVSKSMLDDKNFIDMNTYNTHLFYIITGDGIEREDIEFVFKKLSMDKSLNDLFVGLGAMMMDNFQDTTYFFDYKPLKSEINNDDLTDAIIGFGIERWGLEHIITLMQVSIDRTKVFKKSKTEDVMMRLVESGCIEIVVDTFKALEGAQTSLARVIDHIVFKN